MLLTTESVRWLAKQGRHEDAIKSLAWVRGGQEDDDEVRAGFAEILVGIEEEARDKLGITWRELVQVPSNRHRLILIICLQFGVQLTGNTSMAYCKSS